MNWFKPCSYDPAQKRSFHATARTRLRRLTAELGLMPGTYDIRSSAGGMAVSGEVTLHGEYLYMQVCQPATSWDSGILIRSCRGRKDYTGGPNHFASLRLLDDLPALADRVRAVCGDGRRRSTSADSITAAAE